MRAPFGLRCIWPMLVGTAAAIAQQPAQAERERVDLTVTAVGDGSVYLDHGRDVGLAVGDRVRLFAPASGDVEAVVRSVSHRNARVELPPGVPLPPVGTRGEAWVEPEPQTERAAATPRAARPAPAHPPWTRAEEPRDGDLPLLVPTYGQRPDERPVEFDGRLFAFGQWNRDQGAGRDSEYLLWRSGVRADAVNLLGAAERVRFAGEFDERQVLLRDRPDQRDTTGRIDLLSVAVGTEAYTPLGAEFGRFLSPHLPEIGLVDGVEVVGRFEGGLRAGLGLGAYPRPFPARDAGDDVGVHAFVDYVADAQRSAAFAVGVQKTWHRGAPDRDLVLLRGELRPAERLTLLGAAKVDLYTGKDRIKGRGPELTELWLSARWSFAHGDLGLAASRFRWPELRRAEYAILSEDLVRDGEVDRLSWFAGVRPLDWLSLRARADWFQDQASDGTSYGVDADVRSLFGSGSTLSLSAFHSDGSHTSGPGLRAALRQRFGDGVVRAGYRLHRYTLDALVTGPETYRRESVELGLSWPIGSSGDLDLVGERWFGDGERAFAVGLYVQWRFR